MDAANNFTSKVLSVAITFAVNELVKEKLNNAIDVRSRNESDYVTDKLTSLARTGVSINRNTLAKRVERAYRVATETTPVDTIQVNEEEVDSETEMSSLSSHSSLKKIGRPKGSTNEKKRIDAKEFVNCINSIAYEYATELTSQ